MKSRSYRLFSICLSLFMALTLVLTPKTVQAEQIDQQFNVEGIEYRVTGEDTVALAYPTDLMKTEVIIPEIITSPGGIKYTVTSIDEVAFQGSTITSVSFYGDQKGTLEIGESVFDSCASLQTVVFPEKVDKIGGNAFANCEALTTIDLPDSLKTISSQTFFGCKSLQLVDFPKDLEKIESSAFWGCTSLKSIELPEGLKEIGYMAFALEQNKVLEYINIPASVTTLGENFLTGGKPDGKTTLVFQGNTPPKNIDENAFSGLEQNKPTVYFPADAVEAYTKSDSPLVTEGLINPSSPEGGTENSYKLELPESFHICPGKTDQLPLDSLIQSGMTLSFSSDNSKVATVDASGKITSHSSGSATITGTISVGDLKLATDSCEVTVGHTYTWVIDQGPTKDQPGSKYLYCVDCHDKKDPVAIPAIGYTDKVENAVYRAYNPNNGEHLYTTNYNEFMHVTNNGWHDEGVAFMTESDVKQGNPLYRVYNPNSGLHHYTIDENEKNVLISLGWNDEGVAWYASNKPQSAPVFRVYNPNDGQHHYTMNKQERDVLVSLGWHDEGLAFRTSPIEK